MTDIINVDPVQVRAEGVRRQAAHKENTTKRFFDDSAHENSLGVAAEIAFGGWAGLEPDLTARPNGDGGVDFKVSIAGRTLTIDVKGARAPIFLLLKADDAQKAADILVLAKVDGGEVWFLGWEHKSVMLLSPLREFGYGIENHYRHHSELRPMWQLMQIIRRRS